MSVSLSVCLSVCLIEMLMHLKNKSTTILTAAQMTITTNWVQNVYLYTNTTIYELNNPSQRRRGYNQVKNKQSCRK